MNLEDIAHKAGVSRSTVSRVINKEPYVSEATRKKVMQVIEAEGYSPHHAARTLARRFTEIIGVVIPGSYSVLFDTSLYYPTLLRGISMAAYERDYAMLLWIGDESEDQVRFSQRIVGKRMVDGFVIISPPMDGAILHSLVQANVPFVSADRTDYLAHPVNFVTVENVQSTRNAINHLIGLGRRRIGTVTGQISIIDVHDRIQGYKEALIDAGIGVDADLIYVGEFTYEQGYNGANVLLQRGVDAIFAHNNTIASGVINAIHDSGRTVPGDVAVVGFDDLPAVLHSDLRITALSQPVQEKGYRLGQVLIDLVEGKLETPQQIYIPAPLVVGDTCGGKRSSAT